MLKWWKSKQMIQEMLRFKQTWNYCVDMSSAKWWWWPLVFRLGQVRDLWEVNIEPLSIWRREAGCQPGLQSGFFALTNWFSSEWCKVGVTNTSLANAYREVKPESKTTTQDMVIMKQWKENVFWHKLTRYLITLMVQNIPEGSYLCLSVSFYSSMNVRESHLCPKQILTPPNVYWTRSKTSIKMLLLKSDNWTINFPQQSVLV